MTKGYGSSAVAQYKQLDLSSSVENATPHQLIQMLMARALQHMAAAGNNMEQEDVGAKGEHISRAIEIINGLQASLNHKHDPQMSANFDELYGYMIRRLLEANLQNDRSILDEVRGLLGEIKEAWDAIADEPLASVPLDERDKYLGKPD